MTALCTTSSLGNDLQVLGQGSVPYRGEGQHSDVIGLVWSQTLDSDEVGAAHHLLLPLRNAVQTDLRNYSMFLTAA